MPYITSSYKPPSYLWNGHLQTIFPSVFRKVSGIVYQRERLITPDDDFLDLDWSETADSKKLVIVSHGLEGNSKRPYVTGMVRAFTEAGFSVLAWNFRGCSGEMNKTLRFYHSGATEDLSLVVSHAIKNKGYQEVFLVGFSLGGNMTLKYLGENTDGLPKQIKAAMTVSVPLNLHSCSLELEKPKNTIYQKRFLKNLIKKILIKSKYMPAQLESSHCKKIRSLKEFDDLYTAPLHGFKDALEYYQINSSIQFVEKIQIPCLILNAVNDPFLSEDCYPVTKLGLHPHVYLETPLEGGHCGFPEKAGYLYYSEKRAIEFFGRFQGNLQNFHRDSVGFSL